MIKNCPVTIEDVKIAEDIWGKDISYLKGKTTRNKPPVVKFDLVEIPKELKAKGYLVTLSIYTIYINGIGFLTSIGYPMYYRKCSHVEDTTEDEFYRKIDKAIMIYNRGGVRVNMIKCDGEFKSMMDRVSDDMDIMMNYTNTQDHSSRAERNNRVIKESFRSALHRTGYKTIPKLMIIALAELSAERLNMFPAKHGMSSYYSPEAIVTQKTIDFHKHCKYSFGEYVQAHHENVNTSDMKERTIDAIYLCPNNNMQSGHVCMNLSTGKRITRSRITAVPLTEVVKNRVEQMAVDQAITYVKFTNKMAIDL